MSKSSIIKGASVEEILPDRWHSLKSVMYKYLVENVLRIISMYISGLVRCMECLWVCYARNNTKKK